MRRIGVVRSPQFQILQIINNKRKNQQKIIKNLFFVWKIKINQLKKSQTNNNQQNKNLNNKIMNSSSKKINNNNTKK